MGKIFGTYVYQVKEARLEMIFTKDQSCLYNVGKSRIRETKYLGLYNSIDVTDFYFSYEIDLTNNLETIALQMAIMNGVLF